MSKKRVHEIAKEQGLSSKELLVRLKAAGVEVKAAASSIDETVALQAFSFQRHHRQWRARGGPAKGFDRDRCAACRRRGGQGDRTRRLGYVICAGRSSSFRFAYRSSPRRHSGSHPLQRSCGRSGRPLGSKLRCRVGLLAPSRCRGRRRAGAAHARLAHGRARARRRRAGGRRRVVIDSQASRRQQGGPANQPQRRPAGAGAGAATYDETIAPIDTAAMEATDLIRVNSGSTVKDIAEYLGVAGAGGDQEADDARRDGDAHPDALRRRDRVLADEFDKQIEIVHAADDIEVEPVFEDAEEDLVERPPVVTIMGHVDHGKTSLLDAIRETEVAAGEAGGITQHIGAYQVHHGGKEITFLDTPGHEAFTAMRARGARVTDLAVIVVAADDGVKPQTEEAIDHAKAADVPIVVAVNKIDKEGAQPERVRTEMTQHGLQPAEWGGEIEFVDVCAKTREGLDGLLDTIQVVTDLEELKANSDAQASGTVIESKLDPGRGPVVSVLIQRGHAACRATRSSRGPTSDGCARCTTSRAPASRERRRASRSRCSASTACRRRESSCGWSRTSVARASSRASGPTA